MKKVLLIGIVVILLVVILFIFLGRNNLEELKISLKIDSLERTVNTTIGYPKGGDVVVADADFEGSKILKNEKKNYSLDLTLAEDSTYADNKEYYSGEDGYEQVTFGNYSGYIIKGTYEVQGKILLEDASEQNTYVYLIIELEPIKDEIDGKDVKPSDLYKLDEVQNILKSIKYDKGEDTVEQTKASIESKEEELKTSNYGEFKNKSRTEGTSDKEGLIFIPSYESPNTALYRAEQLNDNVGVDNYLWYTDANSAYTDSAIQVRIFPKTGSYASIDEYIAEKGDMYHWSKSTIAGKEYDTYEFGTDSSKPAKYSDYYNGAFMKGDKVIEFSYSMFAEIPDQSLGQDFFQKIINTIEYSADYVK